MSIKHMRLAEVRTGMRVICPHLIELERGPYFLVEEHRRMCIRHVIALEDALQLGSILVRHLRKGRDWMMRNW